MLNDEQRELLSNSVWVINTILKEQGLQGNSEMFSIASLFLSQLVQKYDPSIGAKWTTYACKSLRLYIKRVNAKENIRSYKIVSDTKLFYLQDNTDIEQEQYNKFLVEKIAELLTPRELELFQYRLKGMTYEEISCAMNLSHERIRQIWNNIKQKALQKVEFEP